MDSVSAVNPGVTSLLQTLSQLNSPILSSSGMATALQNASPSDVVQLSAAALQLQNVDAIFGVSTSSNSDMSSALANLASLQPSSNSQPPSSTVLSTASPADQLANYQGLFGAATSTGLSGSSLNVLA
jgi:hypothetical protein